MKKFLSFLFLILTANQEINAQFILAGAHGASDYYFDIVPDKTIHAPHTSSGSTDDFFYIDINNDGINDFVLDAFYENGGVWYENTFRTITPLNNNHINISGFDSCFANCPIDSFLYQTPMVDSLSLNDSINNNSNWYDTISYLVIDKWNASYPNACGYSCSHHTFLSSPKYIGVSVSVPAGTLYGWIKIKNVIGDSMVIEEYACNLVPMGIESYQNKPLFSIFPNPFSDQTILQSSKLLKNASLSVYNSLGQMIKQLDNLSGQSFTFNRDNLSRGIYFLRLTENEKIFSVGKLIIADN